MIKKIFSKLWKHKWITLICLVLLAFLGYLAYNKWGKSEESVRYVTGTVEKGTLITTISGTGQVSAVNQVDLSPEVSGKVVSVSSITVGQEVKAGTMLFQVDASEALKSVRDASANLESAKLSLKKLEQATDQLTLLQAENSLAQAQETKQKAEDSLEDGYEDAFNTVSSAFLDLPTIITELHDVLYARDISDNELYVNSGFWNIDAMMNTVGSSVYVEKMQPLYNPTINDYQSARDKYDNNFVSYKSATRYSESSVVEDLLDETIQTVKSMAQSAKSSSNFLDAWVDVRAEQDYKSFDQVGTHQDLLANYIGKLNNHLSSLLSVQRTLQTNREAIVEADRTIQEKTLSLADLKDGPDELDVESQKISITQKENALLDAREKLADYTVRANFDGVIASFDVQKGDNVSSGSSVGTLLTKQQVATLSLNESDVSKVKVGQRATLTFDAIEDLSITGTVAEVDAMGTVSQGVVSYDVKIVFDVQDERVKQNMSVNAEIIVSSKTDVLLVSSSAVKTAAGASYVEVLNNGVLEKKTVVIGDSNDTMTEITSGLSEGDEIVVQTVKSSSSSTKSSSSSSKTSSSNVMGGMGGIMGGAGGPPQ